MSKTHKGTIDLLMRHRVAANLLMMLMICSGLFSLTRLNIQFLPTFTIDVVNVQIIWPGASAEDIERSLVNPLEKELRNIESLKKINSVARQGLATVTLEFSQGTDMSKATEKIRERVARVKRLPSSSEKPIITRVEPYERIAKVLVYGPSDLQDLRAISYKLEKELFSLGIGKIETLGLPKSEIQIRFNPKTLAKYQVSLPLIADEISEKSRDIPAGTVGKSLVGQHLRLIEKKRSVADFEDLVFVSDKDGERISLKDVARVVYSFDEEGVRLFHQGKPAVVLKLLREADDNSLEAAKKVHQWLQKKHSVFGESLHLVVFEETWQLIKQRIDTLMYNGLSGLVLIVLILFLFLESTIAFWVVLGIPTAILASMFVLSASGGSLNMVSLFALILTLGIIVDDTIVVGEESLTHLSRDEPVGKSILRACQKMLPAIFSSSLTTVAAFFPLLFIGGTMGKILFDIPLVVICVLIASLIECFFILPGHLFHSYKNKPKVKPSRFRRTFDRRFHRWGRQFYQPLLVWCLKNRSVVFATVVALFAVTISLLAGNYIKFTFFPTPDSKQILAQVRFAPGTPELKRRNYLNGVARTLNEVTNELEKKHQLKHLIKMQYSMLNRIDTSGYQSSLGQQYATYYVELSGSENRPFSNAEFIQIWLKKIRPTPFVENLSIVSPKGGPPGRDVDINITGNDIIAIKEAVEELKIALSRQRGVYAIEDNLPFAQEQLIFKLNERGLALGLTNEGLGRQLRAAFEGITFQTNYTSDEEIDVKVRLEDVPKNDLSTLSYLPILTKDKRMIPLRDIVTISYRQSPEVILHNDTHLSAAVYADVDGSLNNTNNILSMLEQGILKRIEKERGLQFSFKGRAEMQADTLADMKLGLIVALLLIYIILAWVFASYKLPFLVMLAIPLGLIGAILGHFIMDLDLTLMSLFGLFGLSGIVMNDSIILVREYQFLRTRGLSPLDAVQNAALNRLRAVILTSVTTIAGLTPLLFERSRQAQFLIPMANSICFGLFFAIGLILIVVPVLVLVFERLNSRD